MTRGQKSKCEYIAEAYGATNQEKQTVSELSELLYVLTRRPDQRQMDWKNELLNEIADVEIMCQQLLYLYAITEDELYDRLNFKLNRQLDRIRGM